MPGVSSPPPEPEAFVFALYCFPGLCPVFSHIQTVKNLHLFSIFGEADEGTAGQGKRLEHDRSSLKQCEGVVLCTLPWVFANLQSRQRASAAGQGMSLWHLSPGVCASCRGKRRKVCSHPVPQHVPSWKSGHRRWPWHPTTHGGAAGSSTAPSFPSNTAFRESMAQQYSEVCRAAGERRN